MLVNSFYSEHSKIMRGLNEILTINLHRNTVKKLVNIPHDFLHGTLTFNAYWAVKNQYLYHQQIYTAQ